MPISSMICSFLLPIVWKSWQGIEQDNRAFESMTAGASALHGEMGTLTNVEIVDYH